MDAQFDVGVEFATRQVEDLLAGCDFGRELVKIKTPRYF